MAPPSSFHDDVATNAAYQLSQITLKTKTPPRLLVFLVYRLIVCLAFVCVVVYVFMFCSICYFLSFLIVNYCLFGETKMNI